MNTAQRTAITVAIATVAIPTAIGMPFALIETLNALAWQLSYIIPGGVAGAGLLAILALVEAALMGAIAFVIVKIWSRHQKR